MPVCSNRNSGPAHPGIRRLASPYRDITDEPTEIAESKRSAIQGPSHAQGWNETTSWIHFISAWHSLPCRPISV